MVCHLRESPVIGIEAVSGTRLIQPWHPGKHWCWTGRSSLICTRSHLSPTAITVISDGSNVMTKMRLNNGELLSDAFYDVFKDLFRTWVLVTTLRVGWVGLQLPLILSSTIGERMLGMTSRVNIGCAVVAKHDGIFFLMMLTDRLQLSTTEK